MCDELPRQDSNLDKEDQNLSCYLVTLRGKGYGAQSKRLYTPSFASTFERSPRIPPASPRGGAGVEPAPWCDVSSAETRSGLAPR